MDKSIIYFYFWIICHKYAAGQNVCPVTDMIDWPTRNEASEYFDNTLQPDHTEEWRMTWMSQLQDDHRFNNVTIPGTHQSFSHYWTTWAQCNTWALSDQLAAGLRFFDIRTIQIYDEILIYHDYIYMRNCLDNVIQELVTFLETHPSEFVMFRLDQYTEGNEGNTLTFTEAVWNITDQYSQEYFWKEPVFPSTIGDVRGKIIILHEWDDPDMWGLRYGDNSIIEDERNVRNEEELLQKWEGIVEHLDEVPNGDIDTLYIMYNSANGFPDALYWTPANVARETNALMYNHLPTLESPSRRGVILFDYPGYDIIGDVIQFNEDVVPIS